MWFSNEPLLTPFLSFFFCIMFTLLYYIFGVWSRRNCTLYRRWPRLTCFFNQPHRGGANTKGVPWTRGYWLGQLCAKCWCFAKVSPLGATVVGVWQWFSAKAQLFAKHGILRKGGHVARPLVAPTSSHVATAPWLIVTNVSGWGCGPFATTWASPMRTLAI